MIFNRRASLSAPELRLPKLLEPVFLSPLLPPPAKGIQGKRSFYVFQTRYQRTSIAATLVVVAGVARAVIAVACKKKGTVCSSPRLEPGSSVPVFWSPRFLEPVFSSPRLLSPLLSEPMLLEPLLLAP